MSVPDSTTFLGWTGKKVAGGSLSGICSALQNYSAQHSIDGLYIIFKECEDWKKNNVSKFYSSSSELKKENAVNRLLSEVTNDLNAATPGLGDALLGYQHKKKTEGVVGGKHATLGAGYANERASYLASGKKQAPLSGSKVHTAAGDDGVNFGSLSLKEFENYAGDKRMVSRYMNERTVVRMYFANKIQRLRLLATCDTSNAAHPVWRDISGNLMSTKKADVDFFGEENACQMWAMDRYGNLLVDYDNGGYGRYVLNLKAEVASAAIKARGQTNHSSFCAGRDVICAGNIFFWKGQLIHIDNGSGHYAPNQQALYNAVSILFHEGTAMDYLRVGVQGGPTVATKFYKARTFLANGAADWPEQNWKKNQNAIFSACPGFHL